MKYDCIIFDHDDTVVKTTPEVHFPSFQLTLKKMRPQFADMTLNQFVSYCFDPGFYPLCMEILGFSPEERAIQYADWINHVKNIIPDCYDGLKDLMLRFKNKGGKICVASHSEESIIKRDYLAHFGFLPDLVFGWGQEEQNRKPHPYPLTQTNRLLKVDFKKMLVVDDLKPGFDMAKSVGADFAYAGWSSSNSIPQIHDFFVKNADHSFFCVEELKDFVLSD